MSHCFRHPAVTNLHISAGKFQDCQDILHTRSIRDFLAKEQRLTAEEERLTSFFLSVEFLAVLPENEIYAALVIAVLFYIRTVNYCYLSLVLTLRTCMLT